MTDACAPAMSVVLVTPDNFETIRRTVRHLHAQTARGRLELVIVTPKPDELNLDPAAVEGFCALQVVPAQNIETVARGNAQGARCAAAPVVVFAEDHSFPEPDWAEALIEAHKEAYAAVGPVIRNANPGSVMSWADLIIAYGDWIEPAEAGVVAHLPGHNSSYKRDLLLAFDSELEFLLEAESVLHWRLRARGYQLYLQPRAKTHHLNYAIPSAFFFPQFFSGRSFGANRSADWSPLKRLVFAGGAWLIPFVRLRRMLPHLWKSDEIRKILPRLLPLVFAGLVIRSLGEMAGYALNGANEARRRMHMYEFHRLRHIRPEDRQRFTG